MTVIYVVINYASLRTLLLIYKLQRQAKLIGEEEEHINLHETLTIENVFPLTRHSTCAID